MLVVVGPLGLWELWEKPERFSVGFFQAAVEIIKEYCRGPPLSISTAATVSTGLCVSFFFAPFFFLCVLHRRFEENYAPDSFIGCDRHGRRPGPWPVFLPI